jgi:hypothetical protein
VNYKQNSQALTNALQELKQVKAVRREYDYWVITLLNDLVIYLGEDLDTYEEGTSWNNKGYTLEGASNSQVPADVAAEFGEWAKQQIKEGN